MLKVVAMVIGSDNPIISIVGIIINLIDVILEKDL